jgi:hypothetical protein
LLQLRWYVPGNSGNRETTDVEVPMDEGTDARTDGIQELSDEDSQAALHEADVSEIPDEALSGVSGGDAFSFAGPGYRLDVSCSDREIMKAAEDMARAPRDPVSTRREDEMLRRLRT